jgi:membrane dipeptidase
MVSPIGPGAGAARSKRTANMTALAPSVDSLLRDALVWDNHACLPLYPGDERFLPDLERFARSGVNVVGINVGFGDQSVGQHIRMLAHFRSWIKQRPDRFLIVERVTDIQRAKDSGRLGIFFDIEGANAIADQLSLVALYYDLGVRWMLMAYNLNNKVGGGCLDHDEGLTAFGREVVAEMNRVGMVPCCSHCGQRTALEVIEHSNTPVIFSHSNPRAVWEHPRNIHDDVIQACARKGGVICVNGVGQFLGLNDVRPETVARHIDHVVRLVGPDHVALGLDYVFDRAELQAYVAANPAMFGNDSTALAESGCDFVAPEQIPQIVEALFCMDYSESDVRKILGLNLLRIAESVWK